MATIEIGNTGKTLELDLTAYASAAENKRSLRQEVRYLAKAQEVEWDMNKGDLLDQLFVGAGLFDGKFGGQALTMKDLTNKTLSSSFRAPDGSDTSVGARLLYPQLILDTLRENALDNDGSDILSKWQGLVAHTTNIDGQMAVQPVINTSAPEDSESQRIAQLAEPATMVSITTNQRSFTIPTYSIGLEISDQALEATTIDLVRIVMEAQARGQRVRNVHRQLKSMVFGDIDLGMDALPTVKAKDFDPSITEGMTITKKAWLKWLLHSQYTANLSKVLTGVDEAIALDEGISAGVGGQNYGGIDRSYVGVNLGLKAPDVIPFDSTMFGAGVVVGLDPRYAIQRMVNVSAAYDAVEDYVMRRSKAFRVDYGEISRRFYDEAWSVMELSV